MKRLMIITISAERHGGSDSVLWSFLNHLDRKNLDPSVVFFGDGPLARDVESLGFDVSRLPAGRLRQPGHLFRSVGRLASLMRERDPDLILNWLSTAQIYGAPAALRARMPDRVVWWQHDMHSGALSRGRALDQVATLLPAVAVGACSYAAAEAQRGLRPRRPVVPVQPGIDAGPKSDRTGGDTVRTELAIPSDRFLIGSVGRILPWKGHDRVLEAAERLTRSGHDVHALVVGGVGDDSYRERLAARARSPSLSGRVTFTGHVEDAAPYIQALDVLVSGSENEPFGLVILEAMEEGVPVVAPDQAGPGEILEHGRTGWLVDSFAPTELAGGVAILIEDPDLRHDLAAAALEARRGHFTAERMTREMEAMFSELGR